MRAHTHTDIHVRIQTGILYIFACVSEWHFDDEQICFCPVAVQNDVWLSSCISDLRNSLSVSPHRVCVSLILKGVVLFLSYRRDVVSF